ncbi:MAG: SDR family oxidoreductase [Gammaproteobacteria bacterium]
MKLGLEGKTALVTGSTAGIGFATAVRLAEEGAAVVINGRTDLRVAKAAAEIRKQVPKAQVRGAAADISMGAGCRQLISEQPEVDVLVNNMGIFEPKPFLEIPDEDWLRFFEANVMSGVRLARHYLRGMLAKKWGRVVFVSSESAVQIPAEMVHYGMTKTAQTAVARGIAESFPASGVTINSVLAGPTNSEGVAGFVAQIAKQRGVSPETVEQEFFSTARPSSLLKRFIRTEEVANFIAYLCSEAASATTGSALRVDGGVVRAVL